MQQRYDRRWWILRTDTYDNGVLESNCDPSHSNTLQRTRWAFFSLLLNFLPFSLCSNGLENKPSMVAPPGYRIICGATSGVFLLMGAVLHFLNRSIKETGVEFHAGFFYRSIKKM